jgi:hypothetical protein
MGELSKKIKEAPTTWEAIEIVGGMIADFVGLIVLALVVGPVMLFGAIVSSPVWLPIVLAVLIIRRTNGETDEKG